ncbi:MAG TPA: DUF6084 family protein [Thermoleophilaceae bacterium]|nr:DUF6084 family protein [Thermoleophilaceae bacterium]
MAVSAHPGAASAMDAPQLEFSVESAHAVPYAAVPTLGFALRIERPDGGEVRSVALNAQLRIAAAGRSYSSAEQERLFELFGRPQQFAKTVRSLLWANASANVPGFRGSTVHELTIPCTYDFEVAAAKYLEALEGGEVPLELLFSGGIFYPEPGGRLQVASISWDREAEYRLPVAVWREAMREHFGDSPWLRLGRASFERLHAYKARGAFASWDDAVDALLAAAPESDA